MNEEQAIKMDKMLVGPRLFCVVCSESKVLSPCYYCRCSKMKASHKLYCHGCGWSFRFCKKEREICRELEDKRLLLRINEIFMKQEVEAHFFSYQIRELPKEIGLLTNLQYLGLSNNQLRELPAEIKNLTNLQTLHLHKNKIRKLPAEIGKLTNLQILYLNDNKFRELPIEIKLLTNLNYLNIENNPISKNVIQELKKALPSCEIIA